MWYYIAPGFLFLLFTTLLLVFVSMSEPDRLLMDDLTGEKAPALLSMPLNVEQPLPNPALLATSTGKPVLINFFASWCAPCEAEMPFIIALKEKYGVTVVGIAWNDTAEKVGPWVARVHAPFDFVGVDDGTTAEKYHVRGLPESFLLNQSGTVVRHVSGPLTPEIIEREMAPYLSQPASGKK